MRAPLEPPAFRPADTRASLATGRSGLAKIAALAAALAIPTVGFAQSPVPGVCLVATAADGTGAPVSGLTPQDIQLAGDGRPQTVVGLAPAPRRASVVVLLDISGSVGAGNASPLVQFAAAEIIGQLASHRIRFGRFAQGVRLSPRFTQDGGEMLAFVKERELLLGTWSRVWDASDAALAALSSEERPVLILISDGHDTDSVRSRKDVERRAQTECVPVYSLGMRSQGGSVTPVSSDLRSLANATGGNAYRVRTREEISAAVAAIAAELSRGQYVLTLDPATRDGKRHKLARPIAPPGVTLRIPDAYYAPKSEVP